MAKKKNETAAALGAKGGSKTSPAKKATARANGAKGGRPKLKKQDNKKAYVPKKENDAGKN